MNNISEQEIRDEAERYATDMDNYLATEHCLSVDGFKAGVQWLLSQQREGKRTGTGDGRMGIMGSVRHSLPQQTKTEKTAEEIWEQMDDDMLDSSFPTGEVQGLITHWKNKYHIQLKQFQHPDPSSSLRDAMEKVDEYLQHQENYMHGVEGRKCSEARGIIQAALNNTDQSKPPSTTK